MNVTDPLVALARSQPDEKAILTPEGTLTFAALNRAVNWAASQYLTAGLASGDVVAIELTNQVSHLIVSLALARIGATQLTIRDDDPPMVRDALFGQLGITASIGGSGTGRIDPPVGDIETVASLNSNSVSPRDAADHPFIYVRSSGTVSGVPRLGALSHHATSNWFHRHLNPTAQVRQEVRLSLIDIQPDAGKTAALAFLLNGGCIAFFPQSSELGELVDFIRTNSVDHLAGFANHAAILLQAANHPRYGTGGLFPNLKSLQLSYTVTPEPLRQSIVSQLTPNLFIVYGAIEVGSIAWTTPAQIEKHPGSIGQIRTGAEMEIVDENGQPVPAEEVGFIRLRSDGQISGYINDPEATAKKFRDGWFYPGDRGTMSKDGVAIFRGRSDDVIVYDGVNIDPGQVEEAYNAHPNIVECAAFGVTIAGRGAVPIIAIVARDDVDDEALMEYGRQQLGNRGPIGVLRVKALPRNQLGKVVRRELAVAFGNAQANRG
jgi:acyl-coenzyme A synthetase/AMP-(fatty) acid ligase